ncbi:hypothetical protein Nepgr_031562 [Nepenthes gracilis]|uniref:Uncharacterized protein n=1 Tax=Nepenthes gracilis TaxID=150966 RepID=A0AAD3TII8_NEPGR|nr:hypothetical protein Nepgr_031562 [Nepenthes gracilis]
MGGSTSEALEYHVAPSSDSFAWLYSEEEEEEELEEEEEEEVVIDSLTEESSDTQNDQLLINRRDNGWPNKSKSQFCLEGYVETVGDDDVLPAAARTKSLTDEDLEELKGCLDLGFGFSYEEIPELCNTLPALELCYSMSQKFLDQDHYQNTNTDTASSAGSETSSPIASWKISSPGDDPEDVKARLKYWAQAVACTIRLCN